MISCILLTAGESTRFGSPKALIHIHSQKAIEHVQQLLIQSIVDEIIIVTGACENLIKPHVLNHSKVKLVYNKDYKFGQTSSFQTGLNSVDSTSLGFMLLPIDCPFVSLNTFNELVKEFNQFHPDILIPAYLDQRGHPPIFHSKLKDKILKLSSHQGLNQLIPLHQTSILNLDDPGIIQTFNTPAEFDQIINDRHSLFNE